MRNDMIRGLGLGALLGLLTIGQRTLFGLHVPFVEGVSSVLVGALLGFLAVKFLRWRRLGSRTH